MTLIRSLAACGLVLIAGSAGAQEVRERTTVRTDAQTGVTTVHKITEVIGSTVMLEGQTRYGKVEDIVLNDQGCIEYVVVSADEKFVVVPWTFSRVDFGQRVIHVDVTREQLQPLVIDRGNWATVITQPQFGQRIQRVFGNRPGARIQGRGDINVRPRGADRRDNREEARDRDREAIRPRGIEPRPRTEVRPRDARPEDRPKRDDRPVDRSKRDDRPRDRDDRPNDQPKEARP